MDHNLRTRYRLRKRYAFAPPFRSSPESVVFFHGVAGGKWRTPSPKSLISPIIADVCCSWQMNRACLSCQRVKARCERQFDGGPCARCVRIGQECVQVPRKKKDPVVLIEASEEEFRSAIRELDHILFGNQK